MLVQARDKNIVGGTHAICRACMWFFLPLLLILAVVLLLGVPARSACADDASVTTGIKISTQGGKTHEYAAYKLLSGSVSNGKITNASLDGCVSAEAYKEAGATTADIESAQTLIGWLSNKVAQDTNGVFTQELANAVIVTKEKLGHEPLVTFSSGDTAAMDQGYWLIIPNEAQNDAQYKPQPMLVPIEGGKVLEVTEKKTVPVSTKQLKRANSSDDWGYYTSAGEGDVVDFRVSTTLPSNLKAFTSYTLWLYDELHDGLEFIEGSGTAYVVHPVYRAVTGSLMALMAQADQTMEKVNLDIELLEDGRTVKMGSADILAAIPGLEPTDTLVMMYSCTLCEGATFGFNDANESVLRMEYTANPNDAEPTKSDVKVTTGVYSFQLDLRKIGENNTRLADASFIIQNADGEYRTAANTWSANKSDAYVAVTNSEGTALFEGLGAGTYTLTETKAPSGYKLLANPIKVSLTIPDGDVESHTLTATVTGGNATVVSVDADKGLVTVQVQNEKTGSDGGSSNGNNSNGGSNNSNSGSNNESNNNSNNGSNNNGSNSESNSSTSNSSNTGSNNTGGSSSSNKASGTSNSPASVISNALSSVLPATGDPLFMIGGGTLVVSIGLIIWGKKRRSLQDDEGGER